MNRRAWRAISSRPEPLAEPEPRARPFRGAGFSAWLIALSWLATVAAAGEPLPRRLHRLELAAPAKLEAWGPERRVGVVEFLAPGSAPDGADLVVIQAGRPVESAVLAAGPGDLRRVAFACGEKAMPAVLYGLPAGEAPPKPADWTPPAGLLLTVWPLPENLPADNLGQMRRLLAQARQSRPFGCDFVGEVFHGYNAFSAAEKFVSLYQGWLGCPADGEYVFVTTSDDASFMLLDGKLAVAWPGGHGAVADARHSGKLKLTKGVHRFEYYHCNFGGPTIAVAAWQPPDEKRAVKIPAASFAPVNRFTPAGLFAAGPAGEAGAEEPWIEVRYADEAWLEERPLLKYEFTSRLGRRPAGGAGEWRFGDGQTATGATVSHVFLSPGEREIAFAGATGPGAPAVQVRIELKPDFARAVEERTEQPEPLLDAVCAYDFARLPATELDMVLTLLEPDAKRDPALLRAAEAAVAGERTPMELLTRAALLLGQRRRDSLRQPEQAVAAYRQALARPGLNRRQQAELIRQVGDTLFYYLDDLDGALNAYDQVVGRFADVMAADIVRVTKIKIGDIFRRRGQGAQARRVYLEAEALKADKLSFAQETVRKGALYKAVDDYLRRGETEAAGKWLELLEWEFPLEKLDGYSSIARARVALAGGQEAEALKQLLWFVTASPRSAYAAEALFRAGEIFKKRGEQKELGQVVERLRTQYADSPWAEESRKLLPPAEKK